MTLLPKFPYQKKLRKWGFIIKQTEDETNMEKTNGQAKIRSDQKTKVIN